MQSLAARRHTSFVYVPPLAEPIGTCHFRCVSRFWLKSHDPEFELTLLAGSGRRSEGAPYRLAPGGSLAVTFTYLAIF
jgi:hypothetical protein